MNTIRLGIAGLGNIGRFHADYLLNRKINRCELVAVATSKPEKLPGAALKIFPCSEDLIRSGDIDALLIATPHYQHTSIGIDALEQGLHVMVEKPISAHKADAERLIAAHRRHPGLVFGGMFQLRVEPRYAKIREWIQGGALGRLVRVNWIITDWYRTEAYYASSAWRATWKGEGGGVLLNQCLHQLDLLQWLCGQPARVRGFCQMGRFHDIEVDDNVTCYLEWASGATGVFISSTGEAPGTNRLELCGTRGKLVLENNQLKFARLDADMMEFSRTAPTGFAKPQVENGEVPFENSNLPHGVLMQNFVDAILDGAPLIAPGADGLNAVELANALVFSSLDNRTIELPMDGAAWEAKLQQLVAESKHEKRVMAVASDDFAKSFSR